MKPNSSASASVWMSSQSAAAKRTSRFSGDADGGNESCDIATVSEEGHRYELSALCVVVLPDEVSLFADAVHIQS